MRRSVPATTHAAHNDTTSQRRVDRDEGRDAATGRDVELLTSGIVDPAKVVRTALQDAASVSGLLVTTEAMIADKPKKDSGPAMPMGGGGGMGGMDF